MDGERRRSLLGFKPVITIRASPSSSGLGPSCFALPGIEGRGLSRWWRRRFSRIISPRGALFQSADFFHVAGSYRISGLVTQGYQQERLSGVRIVISASVPSPPRVLLSEAPHLPPRVWGRCFLAQLGLASSSFGKPSTVFRLLSSAFSEPVDGIQGSERGGGSSDRTSALFELLAGAGNNSSDSPFSL